MSDEPDLVSLLYRADWTRLSLTAEVSVTRDRDLDRSPVDDGPPPRAWGGAQFGPWSAPQFGPWSAPWSGPWFGPPRGLAHQERGEQDESWQAPEEGEPERRFGVPFARRRGGHEWELATEVLGTESSRFTLLIAPGRTLPRAGRELPQRV